VTVMVPEVAEASTLVTVAAEMVTVAAALV
jgi:hypothetical protein